jgi:hypothetical protein
VGSFKKRMREEEKKEGERRGQEKMGDTEG